MDGLFLVVVGRDLDPSLPGVPGELLIGGPALARGYLNDPGRTAAAFVPNPFAELFGGAGSRLFRSGDLARRRSTGEIEVLGRIDLQAEIRGQRIDGAEVERACAGLAAVEEVVVLVRDTRDANTGRRPIAFWAARPGAARTDAQSLREALRERLPEAMIPTRFIELPELPLTPSGRVDRAALLALDLAPYDAADRFVAPRSEVEERLVGLYQDVLGLPRVGIDDSFFDLGGHSLLANRLLSRIRDLFAVELPLRSVFEAPAPAELAARIEAARLAPTRAPSPRRPSLATAPADEIPLSFAQERFWFLDRFEPGTALYNIPVALRLEGQLAVPVLAAALTEIVARHGNLRTTFPERDGRPLQAVAPPAPVPVPVVDLRTLPAAARESEAARHLREEAAQPFDLAVGPLLRVRLVRLMEDAWLALFTLHHIVGDGWSMGVLVEEIGALYGAFAAGRPSPLPALPLQYTDFAAWQRGFFSGDVLARQVAYWREELAAAPAALELPADRPRPAVQTYRGASLPLVLSTSLVDRVKQLG
ncbi:MAG TPA: condensation domain-containing protein, partial [Thermoanaerobaculia bacterium]